MAYHMKSQGFSVKRNEINLFCISHSYRQFNEKTKRQKSIPKTIVFNVFNNSSISF